MHDFDNLITNYQAYLNSFSDWRHLIKDIEPIVNGNGLIYELENPVRSFNANFAIVDMRKILFSEPHYHPEVEIYFILQGTGTIIVGNIEHPVQKNSLLIISSNTAHFTIPNKDFVVAVVNTPPFNPENYVILTEENQQVKFNKTQFKKLTTRFTP